MSNKSEATKDSAPIRAKIWVTTPGKHLRTAELMTKSDGNLQWMLEEAARVVATEACFTTPPVFLLY